MYRLKISAQAKKELKRIKRLYQQEAIAAVFIELKDDPFIGKPLERELAGKYRVKVGLYRVIYVIDKQNKTITILNVGHRSTVYQ